MLDDKRHDVSRQPLLVITALRDHRFAKPCVLGLEIIETLDLIKLQAAALLPPSVVIPFEDEADAVRIANGAGLAAGTMWITFGPTNTRPPWGGFRGDSAVGRDLGRAALDNYTQQKSVWLQLEKAA